MFQSKATGALLTLFALVSVMSYLQLSNAQEEQAVADAAVGSVRETLKEQGLPVSGPEGGGVTFVQARTAHEIAKAHLARLRLQRMKGELVDRARALALVFRLARVISDLVIKIRTQIILCGGKFVAFGLGVACGLQAQIRALHPFVEPRFIVADFAL